MFKRFKNIFFGFAGSQLAVFLLSYISYKEVTLLSYINISFYIASALLFTSLMIYTVNSGFFDTMSYSFRTVFGSNDDKAQKRKKREEMTPLSELVNINTYPLLIIGLLDFTLMLAGLYVYYL